MAITVNLKNYYKKSYGEKIENIFGDNKREIDLLKAKRFYKKDDTKILNALLKKLAYNKKNYSNKPSNGGYYVKSKSTNLNQQCIFKFRYGNNKVSHKRFIELYMPQLNKDEVKEKPILFGNNIDEYKEHMTDRHFKFIISPENQNVDLEVLTKNFIAHLNKLYDMDLRYLAVQHNDTDHKHVHIVINGVDKNGKELNRIDKNFIKHTARDLLSRMCTIQVGNRTYEEVRNYNKRNSQRMRVTSLDEKIKMQMSKNKNVFFPYKISTLNNNLNRRLEFLEKINLAKKIRGTYFLKGDWYETLQTTGRYNKFLEVKNEYTHKGKPIKLFTNKDGTELKGVVLKIYNMDDEKTWQNGLVLETENSIYYVPSYYKVNTKHLGQEVEITPSTRKKTAIKINPTNKGQNKNRR